MRGIWLVTGAFIWLSCSPSSSKSEAEAEGPLATTQIAESLATNPESLASLSQAPSAPSNAKKQVMRLPPPKKEPWMDTLTDLTGFPSPSGAILVTEDPAPLNKSSVELMISTLFAPKKPEKLVLRVYVTEEGLVQRYQLLKTSNPKLGPEYFVRPLLELRFSPPKQGTKPIPSWSVITLEIPKAQ